MYARATKVPSRDFAFDLGEIPVGQQEPNFNMVWTLTTISHFSISISHSSFSILLTSLSQVLIAESKESLSYLTKKGFDCAFFCCRSTQEAAKTRKKWTGNTRRSRVFLPASLVL